MTVVDGGFQHTVQIVSGHKSWIERLERQVPHVVLLSEKVLQVVQCHTMMFVGRQFTAYTNLLIKIVVALLVKGD